MLKSETLLRSEIKIQNTVTTADLKQKIDIASFNEYKHLSSNLSLYRCGYVKDNNMVGRVTIFASGKMISVGTKNPQQSIDELNRAMRILVRYNLCKTTKIIAKVQNIVTRFDFRKRVSLEKMARTLPRSMYEPEQFPGLIFRIRDSTTALIFSSGKGILVGAKSIKELNSSYFEVRSRMEFLS